MTETRTIAKFSGIYAMANLINRSAGLILIPLYTHALSPTQYGLYAMVQTVADIFGLLAGMGIAKAMGRYFFEYDEDDPMRNRVISTTILGFLGIGLLLIATAYPLAHIVTTLIYSSSEHATLFALALASLVFTLLFEIEVNYLVMRKLAWPYLLLALAKALLLLICNGVLVLHLKLGVAGIVYSMAISLGILAIVAGIGIIRHTGTSFSIGLFQRLIRFGLPLVPSATANAAIALSQRYFLNSLIGPVAVGIYALADRLASLLQLFVAAPFSQIFLVRRFETLAKGEDQQIFHQILLLFVCVMGAAVLFLSLFSIEINTLIAPHDYNEAAQLIPLLALCYALSSINLNIELGILYQKQTWAIATIAFITLGLSIPCNYLLIDIFGINGAAYAYILINIIRLALTVLANSRVGASLIRLDWMRAAVILILATGLGVITTHQNNTNLAWIAVKLALFSGFILLTITTPILDKANRRLIASLWRWRSQPIHDKSPCQK